MHFETEAFDDIKIGKESELGLFFRFTLSYDCNKGFQPLQRSDR